MKMFLFSVMVDPEYMVKAVLSEANNKGITGFKKGSLEFHEIFHEASQEFPSVMGKFEFDENYSPTLNQVLWILEQSRIFGPDPRGGYRIERTEPLEGVKVDEEVKGAVEYICDKLRK